MTTSRDGQIIDADRRSAAVDTPAGRKWVRWTRRMKDAFLDELAASCNVLASAEAIGVTASSVYALRRRDEAFAEAWQEALAQGYVMLETQLVGHALAGGGPKLTNGDPMRPAVDVDLALKLMSDHRERAAGKRAIGGPKARTATRADTNAAIMKKLKALEHRLGLPPLAPIHPDLIDSRPADIA